MGLLAPQVVGIAGLAPAMQAAAVGGDTVKPNPRSFVKVTNGSGASINVTVAVPGNTQFGQPQPDVVVAVAAGASKYIGPFSNELRDPADGFVHLSYSAVASVTVAALSV